MFSEIWEYCPHCECESLTKNYDPEVYGYIVNCSECGKQICLCDECMHAADNTRGYCDWHVGRVLGNCQMGKCFRGVTFNRF